MSYLFTSNDDYDNLNELLLLIKSKDIFEIKSNDEINFEYFDNYKYYDDKKFEKSLLKKIFATSGIIPENEYDLLFNIKIAMIIFDINIPLTNFINVFNKWYSQLKYKPTYNEYFIFKKIKQIANIFTYYHTYNHKIFDIIKLYKNFIINMYSVNLYIYDCIKINENCAERLIKLSPSHKSLYRSTCDNIINKLDEFKKLKIDFIKKTYEKMKKEIEYCIEECDTNLNLINAIYNHNKYNYMYITIIYNLQLNRQYKIFISPYSIIDFADFNFVYDIDLNRDKFITHDPRSLFLTLLDNDKIEYNKRQIVYAKCDYIEKMIIYKM